MFAGEPILDHDIHYLHIGGTYLIPEKRVHPFVGGGFVRRGACDVRMKGDVFGQFELLAGISFGL